MIDFIDEVAEHDVVKSDNVRKKYHIQHKARIVFPAANVIKPNLWENECRIPVSSILSVNGLLLRRLCFCCSECWTRGVITIDGVPGMFLNPTSDTLNKDEISIQACISTQDWLGDDVHWKGAFIGYGRSDRFNHGFSHAWLDNRTDHKVVDASSRRPACSSALLLNIRVRAAS